jgi:uncharacterized protein with PQ loop repeat
MVNIDKSIYYYLILCATFLFSFAFIPIVFEVIQQKITLNIPYLSLICLFISFIIFLFVAISRQYYIHIFVYLVGLISISIILFLKKSYDKKTSTKIFNINDIS